MPMQVERFMGEALAIIRDVPGFRFATMKTAEAVTSEDADGDGRLDASKDAGSGTEPGRLEILVPLFEIDESSYVHHFTDEQLKPEAWYVIDEARVVSLNPIDPLSLAKFIIDEVKTRRAK